MGEPTCPYCGQPVPARAEFCPSCGESVWREDGPGDDDGRSDPAPGTRADTRTYDGAGERAPGPVVVAVDPVGPELAAPAHTCPRCHTANDPHRYFCRRCGRAFPRARATTRVPAVARRPVPWWRRLLGRARPEAERAALRAYRRSLPMRYTVFRAGATAVVVALLVAAWAGTGGDPVGFARDRWDDLRQPLRPVAGVAATPDPPGAVVVGYEAALAVDGSPATAWGTVWPAGAAAGPAIPGTSCHPAVSTGALTAGALLLALQAPADLRAVDLIAGLPDGDTQRVLQWRPRIVELRFADGTCQSLELDDVGTAQRRELATPVSTSTVRVDVLDAYPPQAGTSDRLAVSEITLLQRPPRS